jgi:hypothetical protein
MNYAIAIEWDAEAGVRYVEDSNVPGLVGEAPTLEAMMALLRVRVPEILEKRGCPRDDHIPLRLVTRGHLAQIRQAT